MIWCTCTPVVNGMHYLTYVRESTTCTTSLTGCTSRMAAARGRKLRPKLLEGASTCVKPRLQHAGLDQPEHGGHGCTIVEHECCARSVMHVMPRLQISRQHGGQR